MSEYSLLGGVTRADLRRDPYPHIVIDDCLPAPLYEELARTYADDATILELESGAGRRSIRQNSRHDVTALRILSRPDRFTPSWRAFIEYHTSNLFFQEVLRLMGTEITAIYPQLERRLACPLVKITTGALGAPGSRDHQISLDCHIGINTPPIRRSSVRRVHTDAPDELFAALLYFRREEDNVTGGDLQIFRWKPDREHAFVGSEVDESDADLVCTVPYRANTAVIFINSDSSLHAVSQREPTPLSRRLVNVMGRFGHSLPDGLFEKRQKINPWALGRRALQRYNIATGRF